MNLTRRTALKSSAGVLTVGGLAGCLDDVDASQGAFDSAYAAFFALWDWSQAVAGEEATVENPVEFGQLGHGWEPDGDLPREVASSSAFVYLDTPEFSWAQDLAATLESDYETVAAIDGLADIESRMIESGHDHGGEDGDHDGNETDSSRETDIDRGQLDPHVWVDPVLAQEIVTTICDGFVEIDPDNTETYEANAQAYNRRLADLDEGFQQVVDDADRTTVVLASHSSFAYVESRYGFDIHTVTGVSPDAEPSNTEISDTITLVDEIGTDVILYDRFESETLANTIAENSDGEVETMPVTAGAGTLREWHDNDWGFIDQMEQVTIPAFRRALGAEEE